MPIPIIMAIAGIAGSIASAIGRAIAEGDYAKAQKLREDAVKEYGPEMEKQLTRLTAEQQGQTELSNVSEDSQLRGSQLNALRALENEYQTGGMSAADEAAYRLAQNQVAGRAGSDYANINQMLARRGQAQGGMNAAALYSQAGQTAANALGDMASQQQIAARQRALAALEGGAALAGGVRAQDYGIAADRAKAQDTINAFNARLKQGTNEFNSNLEQQDFLNQMAVKNARNRARYMQASGYDSKGQRTADTGEGVGQSIVSFGSAFDK